MKKLIVFYDILENNGTKMLEDIAETSGIFNIVTIVTNNKEMEGAKHYQYIDEKEFAEKILDGTIIEAEELSGSIYGTSKDNFKEGRIEIGLYGLDSIEILLGNLSEEYVVTLVVVGRKTERQMLRDLMSFNTSDPLSSLLPDFLILMKELEQLDSIIADYKFKKVIEYKAETKRDMNFLTRMLKMT